MRYSVEDRCIVCPLVFCCSDCRWKHEKTVHGLQYDCPVCRGNPFLCRPDKLNLPFIQHLFKEHLPLYCKKCNKIFQKMEDLINIDKCTSVSELLTKESEVNNNKVGTEIDEKFDSLYEKVADDNAKENYEAIVSINKSSKTAIITPIIKKNFLVDYESSDNEFEDSPKAEAVALTYSNLAPKTPKPKRQRIATPHVKKFLGLVRQKMVEEYDETVDETTNINEPPASSKTTPSRNENAAVPEGQNEVTTPTSHLQHIIKLMQTATTSTPTHAATEGDWSLFTDHGADSPLSEIENADSPGQIVDTEPSKTESEILPPKLKSIIVTGSRQRLGSADSLEKQVTFQDSSNNTTEASSVKAKKVKFAEDTVFESEPKKNRVYRKPKRMLTPGPQKHKYCTNPRFQALINRFENQGLTMARTPVNNRRDNLPEATPPVGEHANNIVAPRAINFKENSPVVDLEHYSKESSELYKTCIDSPIQSSGLNNAITALSANIAGSLQNCLSSILKTTDEETEIQFKFVITKKKVSVKRIAQDGEETNENSTEVDRDIDGNKENIWSTVAKAVKNVFWRDETANLALTTPHSSYSSHNSTSSSASKRKCEEMSDDDFSPLNHKRQKYEGRIRGRPPLHRSKSWGVSALRNSHSAEQQSLLNQMNLNQDDALNQSF